MTENSNINYFQSLSIALKLIAQLDISLSTHRDILKPKEAAAEPSFKEPPLLGLLLVCGSDFLLLWF